MRTHNADPGEFIRALSGIDFPTSRSALVRTAADKGGMDTEVLFVLEQLPDRSYETLADLEAEVRRVYESTGGLADNGPAAPSRETTADKRVIEAAADPRWGEIERAPGEVRARRANEEN